ncbi:MAG: phosphoenolpyruvate carboxykinase [Nitrospinota bacterium]
MADLLLSKPAKPYVITRRKVIFDYAVLDCNTPEKLLTCPLFLEIVERFIERIASKGCSIFTFLSDSLPGVRSGEMPGYLVSLFRLLFGHTVEEVLAMNRDYEHLLSKPEDLHDFIVELYNYWRRLERFIYIEAPKRSYHSKSSIHHARFIKANDELKNNVLYVYRRVSKNLLGKNPRVYRQLPAGANMGMLLEKIDWNCPKELEMLLDIPFIRISLIEPPLILYPEMNKRKGRFEEISDIKTGMLQIDTGEWFCFPAKVGTLTAYIFFHQDFISLGLSLSNLFEIADYEDIEGKEPEIILLFGLKGKDLPCNTVFYEDKKTGMLIGMIAHSEEVDYFGYFKKMILTLHNIAMLNRGYWPVHGAMVYIKLKDGGSANVVIVGDSGAGKSETLEALRVLADEHICEMKIIFDDMGSFGLNDKGRVIGYGTEIGAFVRLDDLQPGYAYEEIDRSIFMNPDKGNARLIVPITRYSHLIKGYPVDIVLYANNYEQVDDEHPIIWFFSTPEGALSVFRSGARFAKGTTDEKGIVHTYFANPFGAPQRREIHEKIVIRYFNKMFDSDVKVGQIRTRLGIGGYEQKGPHIASKELFNVIRRLRS